MAFHYAISDIHGKLQLFQQALTHIDLGKPENQLYLLGDFIDRGEDSLKTIQLIWQLHREMPTQIFPLLGNHESLFLENLTEDDYSHDAMQHLFTLLTEEEAAVVHFNQGNLQEKFELLVQLVVENRKELLRWMVKLPLFHETEGQIFVHAGIVEEKNWQEATDVYTALWLRHDTMGPFEKDIIMGHTPTNIIAKKSHFNQIYWDGASHFYIDGHAYRTNVLQVLRFDTETKEYTSFHHESQTFHKLLPYKDIHS